MAQLRWQVFAAFIFLTLPWLNPFAPGPSPAVVPLLFSWFCALLVWLLASWGLVTARQVLSAAAWSWLVAGLISSTIGLLQYFDAAADFSPWINQTRYGEAFANLRQRNLFATLTNIAIAALVWLALQRQASPTKTSQWAHAVPVLLAASLLAVGNAISSSRTGLFELVLLCVLFGLWGQWRRPVVRTVLMCSVLVYAVSVFAMPYLAGLDLSIHGAVARMDSDRLCGSRITLWSNVLHLIAQKPWLGWGWGELDYAHFITLYNEPRFCDILDNAHNLPLHLAVELGVPFAVLVCGGFAWVALRQKPWVERDPTRQMAWAVIAVILLHSMLEYPLWYGPFQMAFAVCIGLLWNSSKRPLAAQNTPKKVLNWPLAHILRVQAAIILIAFVGYATWDYRRISQIYLTPETRDAAYRDNTLDKIRSSWLFADQVRFAELLITPLTPANAEWSLQTAKQVLHYSPEPRVIEKLIESAVMLGQDDDALAYLARYRAAFPKDHAAWAKAVKKPL